MKKIILILIATILFGELFAAIAPPSTQGSLFYFSFMRASRGERTKTMTLLVSSPEDATIRLTNPQTGTTADYNVIGGIVKTIDLLYIASGGSKLGDTFLHTNDIAFPHFDCYTAMANTPQQMGYRVEAFKPGDPGTKVKVSVYASMASTTSFDVANVLPVEALGNEYYVVSRSGNNSGQTGDPSWPSEVLIVATEANTQIEIHPTCIIDAQSIGDDILPVIKDGLGNLYITLNEGESYLIRAQNSNGIAFNGANDLSGTLIKVRDDGGANKCKKIAVFSGTQHGSGEHAKAGENADHEYEQLFPTHLWGNNFMVVSTLTGSGSELPDVVRIVASKPCTDIYINSVYIKTINQSEFYEFRLTTPAEGAYIRTSKPVEVALFPTREDGDNQGAPSMITVAPIEQYLNQITFSAAPGDGVTRHQVLITSLTSICQQTTLNGVLLNDVNNLADPNTNYKTWTQVIGNLDYSTIIINISEGISYTLINNVAPTKGGVSAYIYGDGTKIGYGYSVGSAARSSETSFFLNGDPAQNSTSISGECFINSVDFETNFPFSYSSIEWDFGDGTPRQTIYNPANKINHVYTTAGTYNVLMRVFKTTSLCFQNLLEDTAKATIKIYDVTPHITPAKTICKGEVISSSFDVPGLFGVVTPTYYWSTGETTPSINCPDDFGVSKKYWLIMNDKANCRGVIDTIQVTTKKLIGSSQSPTPVNSVPDKCKGTTITSLSFGHPDFGSVAPSYLWSTGETAQTIAIKNDYGQTIKYWVQNNRNGCRVVDTFLVVTPGKIDNTIDRSHDRVCGDASTEVSITTSASGPVNSNVWEVSENGASYASMTPSVNTFLHKYNATATSDFRFTSIGVCETVSKTRDVIANAPFTAELVASSADFTGTNVLPLSGGTVSFEVVTSVPNSYIYKWTPTLPAANTYSKAITEEETYTVSVSDPEAKCSATTNTVTIKIGSVTINTVIYPKGIENKTIAENLLETFTYGYKTIVYNRYGQLVSEKTDAGWDGTYKGQAADAGVYFYVLEYKTSDGGVKQIKGSVEVIK